MAATGRLREGSARLKHETFCDPETAFFLIENSLDIKLIDTADNRGRAKLT
jgi:hypothetical protein